MEHEGQPDIELRPAAIAVGLNSISTRHEYLETP
jgi:hypothetical protein